MTPGNSCCIHSKRSPPGIGSRSNVPTTIVSSSTKCRIVDSKGILGKDRSDIEAVKDEWVDKWKYCQITNAEGRTGGIADALKGADVCILVTEWNEYRQLDLQRLASTMKGRVFLDCRNVYDLPTLEKQGFKYDCFGRANHRSTGA